MTRFKANGNGCPAFEGKTRYFIDIKEVNRECSSNGYVTAYKGGKFWFPLSDPGEVFDCGKSDDFASLDWAINSADTIEVEEDHISYLEKPKVDWEFRKWMEGDTFLGVHGFQYGPEYTCANLSLNGYRWCKPRKKIAKRSMNEWISIQNDPNELPFTEREKEMIDTMVNMADLLNEKL